MANGFPSRGPFFVGQGEDISPRQVVQQQQMDAARRSRNMRMSQNVREFEERKKRLAQNLKLAEQERRTEAETAYAEATGEIPSEQTETGDLYVEAGKARGERRGKQDTRQKAKIVRDIRSAGGEVPEGWRDMSISELQIQAGEHNYDVKQQEGRQEYYEDVNERVMEETGQSLKPLEEYESPSDIRKDAQERLQTHQKEQTKQEAGQLKRTVETYKELDMTEPYLNRIRLGEDPQKVYNDFQQDTETPYDTLKDRLASVDLKIENAKKRRDDALATEEGRKAARQELITLQDTRDTILEGMETHTRGAQPSGKQKQPPPKQAPPGAGPPDRDMDDPNQEQMNYAVKKAKKDLGQDATMQEVRMRTQEILNRNGLRMPGGMPDSSGQNKTTKSSQLPEGVSASARYAGPPTGPIPSTGKAGEGKAIEDMSREEKKAYFKRRRQMSIPQRILHDIGRGAKRIAGGITGGIANLPDAAKGVLKTTVRQWKELPQTLEWWKKNLTQWGPVEVPEEVEKELRKKAENRNFEQDFENDNLVITPGDAFNYLLRKTTGAEWEPEDYYKIYTWMWARENMSEEEYKQNKQIPDYIKNLS